MDLHFIQQLPEFCPPVLLAVHHPNAQHVRLQDAVQLCQLRLAFLQYIGWQFLLQYPEGVSKDDGEKWFYDEVVPYFQKSVFVNRFVSSKVKSNCGAPSAKFDRLCEIWFEGPEEWYQCAVILADKMVKKPDWAEQEHFPYLKPQFNIASMFLGDRATADNLTQYRGFITMR